MHLSRYAIAVTLLEKKTMNKGLLLWYFILSYTIKHVSLNVFNCIIKITLNEQFL